LVFRSMDSERRLESNVDTLMVLIEGCYPEYQRILIDPEGVTNEPGQFDPEILLRFKKADKALQPKRKGHKGGFYVGHNGNRGAYVELDASGEDIQATGVVMPWRM